MPKTTRRRFLAGSILLPWAAGTVTSGAIPTSGADDTLEEAVADDLQRYIDFGIKRAGGHGDNAAGNWMASELEQLGYTIERQTVSVPYFDADRAELTCRTDRAAVWPHPIVIPTGADGITGLIVRVDGAGHADAPLEGAIALVDLPYARWSTALSKPARIPLEAAFRAGARAVVAVTNGPTGKIIALNTDGRHPMFAGPVALLAPEDATPFFAAAMTGRQASLHITGEGGRRPAFNFVGRLNRGKDRWLAISTPRSGWFTCAGERGGGIAAWLHIARWAAREVHSHNLAFICNSGHEYTYLGADEALKAIAPKPAETDFWLHLGANVAARDWHGITGKLAPLPGADSQRYLVVSPPLLDTAREIFAGQAGLEAPYPSTALSAGELTGIIKAGYPSVAGVFGLHRFHHVAEDDSRCVSAHTVSSATASFRQLVQRIQSRD